MQQVKLTAIIDQEANAFVALCPELDVASQGQTVSEARQNLREAVELFLESADPTEIATRLPGNRLVESLEVTIA